MSRVCAAGRSLPAWAGRNGLVEHIHSAKDHIFAVQDAGSGHRRLHFLSQTGLVKLAGLQPCHITCCFQTDPQLHRLYDMANDPEELMKCL